MPAIFVPAAFASVSFGHKKSPFPPPVRSKERPPAATGKGSKSKQTVENGLTETFALLREVKPREFFLWRHSEADRLVDNLENHGAHDAAVKQRRHHACGLDADLRHHRGKIRTGDGARRKDAC